MEAGEARLIKVSHLNNKINNIVKAFSFVIGVTKGWAD